MLESVSAFVIPVFVVVNFGYFKCSEEMLALQIYCVDNNIISIVSSLIEFQFLKIKIDFLNPNVISLLYLFDIYLLHVSII